MNAPKVIISQVNAPESYPSHMNAPQIVTPQVNATIKLLFIAWDYMVTFCQHSQTWNPDLGPGQVF